MDNKKIGVVLAAIVLILGYILFNYLGSLEQQEIQAGCFQNEECKQIGSSINSVHFIFGIMGAIFALGIYLLFFTKGEEAIVRRLEEEKNNSLSAERFSILLRALDPPDQEVMKSIKKQPGITQNTLKLKTDLSKSKLSQVLASLENKGLIVRERQNKTYSIYLKEPL